MMKRISLIIAFVALLVIPFGARADEWNKKTTLTFDQSVELPGMVLPAGTYVFKLVDLPGTRTTVQVLNADGNKVFTTLMAIPYDRAKTEEKTYIGFEERRAGMPNAIHTWLYPGEAAGLEFIYR